MGYGRLGLLGGGGGGVSLAMQNYAIADTVTPTGDPNSIFVSASNEASGWIEVEYTDGAGAYNEPDEGCWFDCGAPKDIWGNDYASFDPSDGLNVMMLEVDAAMAVDQNINLLLSSETTLASGFHYGVGLRGHASGMFVKNLRAGAVVGVTAVAQSTGRRGLTRGVKNTSDGNLRAMTVECQTDAGVWLASANSISAQSGLTAQDHIIVGVGTETGSGSGTKTARFRVHTFFATFAQLQTLETA